MNELQIFRNSEFGELGVLEQNGKPYFPATACARILGYVKPRNAISMHCKGALKQGVLTNGGKQEVTFIPEGDLYRLITHSKLPSAERFEAWVFDEALPTIRRTGGYGEPAGAMEQLIEQLTLTTAALTKVASMMAAPAIQVPECRATSNNAEEPSDRHYCKHRKKKRSSKLLRLNEELGERVDEMILSGDYTYIKVVEYLRESGFQTSTSAVGRYAQMLDE